MISNYFRLSLRKLLKNKLYGAINIFGLAVGIAACLLIFRLVYFEWTFDTFHQKYDRIARIVTEANNAEGTDYTPGMPIPAMDAIQAAVPQLEQMARVHSMWPTITVPDPNGVGIGKKIATDELHEVGIFTEPAFFNIFDWKWLSGDPNTALSAPNTVVLNQKMAEKCFGDWKFAEGKTVLLDNQISLTVRGVVENAPDHSDFPVHVFVSYLTFKNNPGVFEYSTDWGSTSSNDQAFALLKNKDLFPAANQVLASVGQEHYKDSRSTKWHYLQPLSALHFDDRFGGHLGTHQIGKTRLQTLSLIGLLILIMACFNFINLATAQAVSRSREVGVRKSMGSTRGQLMAQFMGETTLIVLVAVALGATLAGLLKPTLKYVSEVPDDTPFLTQPVVLAFLLGTTVMVSLLSGFYPAWVLARFEAVKALKNTISSRVAGGVSLRKMLVVFQFMIAQGLIIGAFVAIGQMQYLRDMDLGYQPDLVYNVQGIGDDSSSLTRLDRFKRQLQAIPAVESVSLSSDVPTSGSNWSSNFAMGKNEDAPFATFMKMADADYCKTYGLRMLAGRWLDPSDSMKEVVVNQTMIKKLGYANPEEVIGKGFRLGAGKFRPIVGVVTDYQANSARQEIKPMSMFSNKDYYSTAGVKIRGENLAATTAAVQQVFEQVYPEQVFYGQFLDESIAEFYRDENRFTAMCKGFALLAVLISCLGLFGLASLMATQRAKEIGVRKVLGASSLGILLLLYKDFIGLVLVALVLASPLAWYGMNAWLSDFVFRIPFSAWIFAGTGVVAVAMAVLTVSFEGLKAALANPVKSLKSE